MLRFPFRPTSFPVVTLAALFLTSFAGCVERAGDPEGWDNPEPIHVVSLRTSHRQKSGAHGDCFHGPVYRHAIDWRVPTIEIDPVAFQPQIERATVENANVLVAHSWYETIGTCGRDELVFRPMGGSFSRPLLGPWHLNFTTNADGQVILENGTVLAPGETHFDTREDANETATTTLRNGGLVARNAIRFRDLPATGTAQS